MEERNLARYPFLRHIGAFSVRRGEPVSSLETLRYARGLLRQPTPRSSSSPRESTVQPARCRCGWSAVWKRSPG
jgi:hypothetical protein